MIQKFFDSIFSPFRQLRTTIFRVQQAPQNLKGEFLRAKSEANSFKSEAKNAVARGKEVKGKAQSGMQGAQRAGASASGAVQPGKVKMGFFSRSKKCPGCAQKLHKSWPECPYCGWGKAAASGAAAPASSGRSSAPGLSSGGGGGGGAGGVNRTMALDLGAGPPAGAGILGWFIPLEGAKIGELFELRGRVTVGSREENQIVLTEASISGHHCEFIGSATGFKLNDLGSTNGTYVNDKRIQSHDLVDNDNVTLGKVRFKFKSLV